MKRMNSLRTLLAVLLCTATLAACADQEQMPMEEEAAPVEAVATDQEAMADTVHAVLTDFEIDMPDTLTAGPVVFHVMNEGSAEHNFEVERGEMEMEFERPLAPGTVNAMRVDLEPGTYEIYCPVGDHEERGMERTLHVVESS